MPSGLPLDVVPRAIQRLRWFTKLFPLPQICARVPGDLKRPPFPKNPVTVFCGGILL